MVKINEKTKLKGTLSTRKMHFMCKDTDADGLK